jgi:hypothetical protein
LKKTGHPRLFQDLCQIHELDKKTVKLLLQIVQKLNMEQPSMIFANPDILRKSIMLPSIADSAETIRELYYRWFGGAI